MGWPFELHGGGESNPLVLYYTSYGQISGLSVAIYGNVSSLAVKRGFIQANADRTHSVSLRFRSAEPCSVYTNDPAPVGDGVAIGGVSMPLTSAAASASGFTSGACIGGMGRHYALDMASSPKMSWVGANLFPLVAMYDTTTQKLTAVFIASITRQQSIFPPDDDDWDVIPITNGLMCKNFCDPKCHFSDVTLWSTMHLWFVDPEEISKCPSSC